MSIHIQASPLRYPGGKQVLGKMLASVLEMNGLEGCVYAEPYAGGAGAALTLLFSEHVQSIMLNDADPCIVAFWKSVLLCTEEFLRLIRDTPITIDEWKRQRRIYCSPNRHSLLRLGFATFYLNRTNRSGIIKNGGPIGGIEQRGKWKVDARFNRHELIRRISRIAMYKDRITVTRMDAMRFMAQKMEPLTTSGTHKCFVYLDPPYYEKGRELYLNHYSPKDHDDLAAYILAQRTFDWVLTYDRVPCIMRLYADTRHFSFSLSYSAFTRRTGRELLVIGRHLQLPPSWKANIPVVRNSTTKQTVAGGRK